MDEAKTHNGWTNYETFAIGVTLDNDEPLYRYWTDQAEEAWEAADDDKNVDTRKQTAASSLAEHMSREIQDEAPELTGFYADLLNAGLSAVNWYELAEHFLENVDMTVESEEDDA